jgi:hypothetical protein
MTSASLKQIEDLQKLSQQQIQNTHKQLLSKLAGKN